MRIKITADSTCDLSPELITQNDIEIFPLFVNKGGESFLDGVTIQPADIFAHVANGGDLCTTAAAPVGIYQERFEALAREYDAVIHVSLGSGFSVTHHNACVAAEELTNVRVIDSRNLSTGQGHVVMEACKLAQTCDDLDAIKAELDELTGRVDTSFLLDRLDYMVKGGLLCGGAGCESPKTQALHRSGGQQDDRGEKIPRQLRQVYGELCAGPSGERNGHPPGADLHHPHAGTAGDQ